MENPEAPRPNEARNAVEFISAMRALKEWSGLTYRGLEQRAEDRGEVLPRSTLADVLRGDTLPRPEILAVFVRACGAEEQLPDWLHIRGRIADAEESGPQVLPWPMAEGPAPAADGARPRRLRSRLPLLLGALLAAALAAVAFVLLLDGSEDSGDMAGAGDSGAPISGKDHPGVTDSSDGGRSNRTPVLGWIHLHPAGTHDFCVTQGFERSGEYKEYVAVQRPCDGAPIPRVHLESVADGLYRIQWRHPDHGTGCLVIRKEGPAKDMLEPWDDCELANTFHIEPVDTPVFGGYRVRDAETGHCLGIVDGETAEGAEVTRQACNDGSAQEFIIDSAS